METITLCGASREQKKYYFNQDFDKIPQTVKDELQIICVTFTEECGGVFTIDFNEEGDPFFTVHFEENAFDLDEIGAEIRVRSLQEDKAELMKQLKLFYRVFIKGEDLADLAGE